MNNWHYLYGKPVSTAIVKQSPEDFIVQEDLGFSLDGEGEHVFIYLRKTGCNTQFVADKLAQFAGILPRDVSYSGLKDRQAVTEQWFCLRLPGKSTPDFSLFTLDGCHILDVNRHKKKLRIGVHKGNNFTLILRDVTSPQLLEQRLQQIIAQGVPNYFGAQRFGHQGQNLIKAQQWAQGEIRVKDRKKRSFYLSAARSAIFNDIVSQRIEQANYDKVLIGDAMQLSGRGSWFVAQEEELSSLQLRYQQHAIQITALLTGKGDWGTQHSAWQLEDSVIKQHQVLYTLLTQERVESARRAMRVLPQQCQYHWSDQSTLEFSFWLSAGCFATTLLRELVLPQQEWAGVEE